MNFFNKITENSKLFLNNVLKNTDGVNKEIITFIVKHKIIKIYWGISKDKDKIWLKSNKTEIMVDLTENDINFLSKYLTYNFHKEYYDIDSILNETFKSLNFSKENTDSEEAE